MISDSVKEIIDVKKQNILRQIFKIIELSPTKKTSQTKYIILNFKTFLTNLKRQFIDCTPVEAGFRLPLLYILIALIVKRLEIFKIV